ncbi:MAG TPA: hypothetical protein VNO86_07870 [Candidatus Binatia bacterium]|nr:hypothetical protein [Candidatus Binatia bacterium]
MSKGAFVPAGLLVAALIVAACAEPDVRPGGPESSVPEATPTEVAGGDAEPTAPPEATPTSEPTPTAEPSPSAPPLFRPGEPAIVTRGGEDYLEITVSKVSQKKKYGSGYSVDTPAKGNVYIEAYVTYTALADGAAYNPFDWQVFCNDTAVDRFTFVLSGPEPELGSGTLPKGRKAAGWLVYEVPAKGRCVLSYGANMFLGEGAIFEVLLRDS